MKWHVCLDSGVSNRTMSWPSSFLFLRELYLYYNYKFKVLIRRRRQKKYEILANMKNAPYTWQKKYENLVEPSSTSRARLSYFFSFLVKICQTFILFNLHLKIGHFFILFQSPCQNLPDCHTFSIFSNFGRLVLVDWAQLFKNLI